MDLLLQRQDLIREKSRNSKGGSKQVNGRSDDQIDWSWSYRRADGGRGRTVVDVDATTCTHAEMARRYNTTRPQQQQDGRWREGVKPQEVRETDRQTLKRRWQGGQVARWQPRHRHRHRLSTPKANTRRGEGLLSMPRPYHVKWRPVQGLKSGSGRHHGDVCLPSLTVFDHFSDDDEQSQT